MINIVQNKEEVALLKSVDKSAITTDGEILEFRPDCPFRSITDLKAFDDAEKKKGVSMTDPSQYEPIESIIKRCMRGEIAYDPNKGWYGVDSEHVEDALDNYEEPVDDLTAIDDAAVAIAEAYNAQQATPPAEKQVDPSPAPSDEGVSA